MDTDSSLSGDVSTVLQVCSSERITQELPSGMESLAHDNGHTPLAIHAQIGIDNVRAISRFSISNLGHRLFCQDLLLLCGDKWHYGSWKTAPLGSKQMPKFVFYKQTVADFSHCHCYHSNSLDCTSPQNTTEGKDKQLQKSNDRYELAANC